MINTMRNIVTDRKLVNMKVNVEEASEKETLSRTPRPTGKIKTIEMQIDDFVERLMDEDLADEELKQFDYKRMIASINEDILMYKFTLDDEHNFIMPPPFFAGDQVIAQYDADNSIRFDKFNWENRKDAVYRKAWASARASTTVRLTGFYTKDAVDNLTRSKFCSGRSVAQTFLVAWGISQTLRDLKMPAEFISRRIYQFIIGYNQQCVPLHKESHAPSDMGSERDRVKEVRIDRPHETTKSERFFMTKSIKAIIADIACDVNISQTEIIRLSIDNAIIASDRFTRAAKKIARADRKLILDVIYAEAKRFAHQTTEMYLHYKFCLDDDEIAYVERRLDIIDGMFDTPRCKYCLSNDTKLGRNKTDKRKAQYVCMDLDCRRTFSVPY